MNRLLQSRWILPVLFVLALVPRAIGLGWGLPSREHWFSFHPDERQIAEAVAIGLDPLGGDFNPNFFNYPSLFIYATWLVSFVLGGLGLATPLDPANANAPWPLLRDAIFAGRLACALFGAAIAPLTFAWARRIASPSVALLAALLVALSPGLVQHSHFATVDVPATFFVVLCLYFTARAQREDELKAHVKYLGLAFFAAGLGAATKYNAVLVAVAPFLVVLWQRGQREYLAAHAARALALLVGGFLLGCPFSVLSPHEFWGDPAKQMGFAYELLVHPREGSGEVFQQTGNGWIYHATFTLPFALTWPPLILGVVGLALAIRNRSSEPWKYLVPAAAFAILYFAAIGTSQVRFLRYVLLLAPPLLVLAAAASSTSRAPRAPQVLAGVLLLVSIWGTRDVVFPFVQSDARDEAAKYLRSTAAAPVQTVAMPQDLWFYSPPLLPFNAKGRRPPGAAPAPGAPLVVDDTFAFDATRLQRERPLWTTLSEFERAEKERLRDPKYLGWAEVLQRDYELAWRSKAVAPLALPGREYVPHDFLYPNPEVRIYKRR